MTEVLSAGPPLLWARRIVPLRLSREKLAEKQGPRTVEEMDAELRKQLDLLERGVEELKQAATQALGFVRTIEYQGIFFNVSRRFVIADLSPLAFFHLIEPIGKDSTEEREDEIAAAVVALHHRLQPLLTCTHEWTHLKREEDERVLAIMANGDAGNRTRICKACTAYALEQSLPVVGRELA